MRSVYVHDEAVADLLDQLDYLIDHDAGRAAVELKATISHFVERLALYPEIGRPTGEPGLWECYIPGTRMIVWYMFSDAELDVVELWHTAQNRR